MEPEFFTGEQMRAALGARDIGTLYRLLRRQGLSQRRIAHFTGQSPSEVSEILTGRQVSNVWVLERIADGLGIPRAWMGLSYGDQTSDTPLAEGKMSEAMKRRALVLTTLAAATGQALTGLPELALPSTPALPSRLGISQVHALRAVTEQLASVARYYGGQAALVGAAARAYTPWLGVPAPEPITAQLAAALAELYTDAGWACYDEGVEGTGYLVHALRLAQQAGDAYSIGYAAWVAGATLVRGGHPSDALKLCQLGQVHLGTSYRGRSTLRADDPRLPSLLARLHLTSAIAYALLGGSQEATRELAAAQNRWEPCDAFERAATDFMTAGIQLDLGHLEAAEQCATRALRTYGEQHRRGRIQAQLLLAELSVRTGESQGLALARQAIEDVRTLHSVAVRNQRLLPLASALHTRAGTDPQQLARIAHQVATQI